VAARDLKTRLNRRAARSGVFLPTDLSDRFVAYYELLAHWNRKINLTALDDPDEAIDRLLLEPLLAARYLPSQKTQIMDIGSGGGSPAIPLKLTAPLSFLTMVEVKARKSAFLREAIRVLELTNSTVETSRYEELLTRPELHEAFEVLTLRAVRVELRSLMTLQAFLRPGGLLFMFRGPGGAGEPQSVPTLRWVATHPLVETLQSRLTILQKVAF
jgi:16S rRNA (guanine527-N7)-methyltransferase